jgi:hypothetical protein
VVFVYRGDGYFEPHTVKLGEHAEKYYVVLSGLEAGERVVTNPVFLIDAESNLSEASGAMGSMPDMNMGGQKETQDSKFKIQDSNTPGKKQKPNTMSSEKKQKTQAPQQDKNNSMPGMKM